MPGLYGPFKVYTPGEVLTAADLNATDQNHITNQTPQMTDDYQLDLAQKRTQTDPALGLATSLAGDIAQLRYALAKVGRVSFWDQIVGPPTTGLFGYVNGFKCSNDVGDPDHDLLVGSGAARSDDNTADIALIGSIIKRLDAVWAVGTGNGMLDGGAQVANTWYFIYAIMRPDTEVVDILASTSSTAPTMPTNYTKKKLIFAVQTDAGNLIKKFVHIKEWVLWKDPFKDQDVTTLSTARTLYLVSAPLGFETEVILNMFVSHGSAEAMVLFTQPDVNDEAPSLTVEPFASHKLPTSNSDMIHQLRMWTNTASQIGARSSHTTTTLRLATVGYRNIV